jgi:hypothetical protein
MASFPDRVLGALQLKAATFEEVEHDTAATGQAAAVVAAGAVSAGLVHLHLTGMLFGVFIQLLGWAIGALVLYLVGTKLLPGKNTEADYGQMLRCAGFAQAPALLNVLGIIPVLGYLIRFALWIWVLVGLVIAVRQALDYDDTARAIMVCAVAWAIMFVITLIGAFVGIGSVTVASGSF